jgi:Ca-activated chloride channel family protein
MPRPATPKRVTAALLAIVALVLAACSGDDGSQPGSVLDDPGDCVPVDIASSPEKLTIFGDLARSFNESDRADLGDGECAFVRVQRVSSGVGATRLAEGWPETEANGPRPVVWSPASSAWGGVLNQRLAEAGEPAMAPPSQPFMLTPLVIAMPEPMAEALGYPEKKIGYGDILALAQSPDGWAAFGHPEWGPFRLGKTNPNFSTSGLHGTIAQYYAAAGKRRDLTAEDLARPEVQEFARDIESAVVHYGDITLTFLNNWYRNDARGTALTYVSAVAVEEKSVIDYNRGDPDGILEPGEEPRPPRVPLVAIYPQEGTLFSDNPFIILDAPWVSREQKDAAAAFFDYVMEPDNQERVVEAGFRPGNPDVAVGDPISAAYGVNPDEPKTTLEVPEPAVLVDLIDAWAQTRKRARVLLVLDVSGSMGELGDESTGETKLDLAKRAVTESLDDFQPDDQVGLRIFSTDLGPGLDQDYLDLVPVGPVRDNRAALESSIESLVPFQGTPLYTVTADSYDAMLDQFDADRINAIVLLTDGRNEDPDNNDLDGMLAELEAFNEGGQSTRPVRIFPIAYGADADLATLQLIADATNAAVYDSSDPTAIESVFTAVVSNF